MRMRKPWLLGLTITILASAAAAGTFGKVVAIGGEASDLALDESRGVLYIANFTANRIDVLTLATSKIQTSINVPPQPSSLSISPDNHWLAVTHYGNNAAPASATNALTLIDLTANNSRQTFSLADTPLGVAFGLDNKALIVTSTSFILFDPALGTTQVLQTVAQVATQAIPQPTASFPGNIVQASIAASRDGLTIAGFGGTSPYLLFRYDVPTHTITSAFYTSSPPAGPRVVSLSDDGSLASMAWWLSDRNFITTAELTDPNGAAAGGLLNLGSHVIDSSRNLVYAQIPVTTNQAGNTNTPILQILDSDNLTVRELITLPENLAGKSILSSDHNTMYSVSDSGVLILPVGNLNSYPRLEAGAPNADDHRSGRRQHSVHDQSDRRRNHCFTLERSHPGHGDCVGGSECLYQPEGNCDGGAVDHLENRDQSRAKCPRVDQFAGSFAARHLRRRARNNRRRISRSKAERLLPASPGQESGTDL